MELKKGNWGTNLCSAEETQRGWERQELFVIMYGEERKRNVWEGMGSDRNGYIYDEKWGPLIRYFVYTIIIGLATCRTSSHSHTHTQTPFHFSFLISSPPANKGFGSKQVFTLHDEVKYLDRNYKVNFFLILYCSIIFILHNNKIKYYM